MPKQIVICGAGIAGLSAGIALARLGQWINIYERSSTLRLEGAGIQLSPNATWVLNELNVLKQLQSRAQEPEFIRLISAKTRSSLTSMPIRSIARSRWHSPYLTVSRAHLIQELFDQANSFEQLQIHFDCKVDAIHADESSTQIDLGEGGQVSADLAIDACGVHASHLNSLSPQRSAIDSKTLAWRAQVHACSLLAETPDDVVVLLSPGGHLVVYPADAEGQRQLVFTSKAKEIQQPGFPGFATSFRSLLSELDWTAWPIFEQPEDTEMFVCGSHVRIGDSAHALTPHAAQGAAMALEDSYCLAQALQADSLAEFDKQRRARLTKVRLLGTFNRFAWQAAGPIAWARDQVLKRRAPEALLEELDWLYGWKSQD